MQEDKTPNRLGSMLRKQQEENPLPYELGAWEAFQKKRAAGSKGKKTSYRMMGIAASLALLLIAGGIWLASDFDQGYSPTSEQLALEDKVEKNNELTPESEDASQLGNDSGKSTVENPASLQGNPTGEKNTKNPDFSGKPRSVESKTKGGMAEVQTESNQISSSKGQEKASIPSVKPEIEQTKISEKSAKSELLQSLIATQESEVKENEGLNVKTSVENEVVTEALPKEPQLTDEEIEEILETPSFTRLALGLSPGFGASQTSSQATSGSSLGFGVMVDRNIGDKLVMGSGLAVNYLNQASESQSYAQAAGFSSPVTETNQIAQVQVDIPLYFKYPVTRNQSISVQAGFSNLWTFNQFAESEASYTREIAVLDATIANSSSFTLRSESVNQLSALEVPQNRFYPFATANLGVNFRLFESKKTSYEVMPFYNYPLQEFSGYGEKLGMFGASFKVNFRNIK